MELTKNRSFLAGFSGNCDQLGLKKSAKRIRLVGEISPVFLKRRVLTCMVVN
jgi:hypothetical protein